MQTRENSIVFSPGRIGSVELKNRLVRSATYENAATIDGEVTEFLVDLYRTLAQGGVGLIITGIIGVYSKALSPALMMRISDDRYIPSISRISRAVHDLDNNCKIVAQLHHPGRQVIHPEDMTAIVPFAPPALIAYIEKTQQIPSMPEGEHPEPVAPSAILDEFFKRTPRELSVEEIEEIIDAFAEGIRRVKEAGFDGVQLHAAHGWLLSSFLSPHTNRREDQYGGSTENRTRILREIYELARKKVGEDFPILIKMNTTDFFSDGTDYEEASRVAEIIDKTGFDAIETSGGMWECLTLGEGKLGWKPYMLPEARVGIKDKDEAYFLPGAQAVKSRVSAPVILVGGIRSLSKIEDILESGYADFVSMARPFIRQPDLPNLWLTGKSQKADCISCSTCIVSGDIPLSCKVLKK